MGVKFLTINVLLYNKFIQKLVGNWFCIPMILKNPLETGFSINFFLYYNLRRVCMDCNKIFLIQNTGLIKVIGIQKYFNTIFWEENGFNKTDANNVALKKALKMWH